MRISLRALRSIIREQLGTMTFIYNAGFGAGTGGISGLKRHKEEPPPGLGDEGEQEKQKNGEEQEKSQWTVSVRDRKLRKRR